MAAINDLISQIQDETLRNRIQKEVSKMAKQKKFGLVFEEDKLTDEQLNEVKALIMNRLNIIKPSAEIFWV